MKEPGRHSARIAETLKRNLQREGLVAPDDVEIQLSEPLRRRLERFYEASGRKERAVNWIEPITVGTLMRELVEELRSQSGGTRISIPLAVGIETMVDKEVDRFGNPYVLVKVGERSRSR